MMRNLKYTAAFVAAVLFATLPVACTDDPSEPPEPTPQSGDLPVRWDVKGVVSSSDASRVMIDDGTGGTTTRPSNPSHPDFFVTLPEVCSVPASGSREDRFAIGLFGDYTYTENGTKVTEYDFYRGDRLVFLPTVEVKDDVLSQWDTNIGMKYWHPGAKYIFRAYYPQRLYNYTVSTSNATTLALTYPSRKLQYDLLLAVKEVTADADQMGKAVELKFQHALAALRFQFKLNFDDADLLTSVYLCTDNDVDDNTGPDEQTNFFSQGTVVFGDEIDEKTDDTDAKKQLKRESIEWIKDYCPPETEILYKWVPPLKYWYGVDANNDGIIELAKDEDGDGEIEDSEKGEELSADAMLAYWGWNKDDVNQSASQITLDCPTNLERMGGRVITDNVTGKTTYGYNPVLMYSSSKTMSPLPGENTSGISYYGKVANAYYGTELYYNKDEKKWVSRTSSESHPNPKEIDEFAPGEAEEVAAEGKLFCRNSGWLLIPPQESFGALNLCFTTKKGGETLYKVKLPVETGSKITVKDEDGNARVTDGWAAGKRYTYEVTISQSNYTVNVSIQEWNERKHSTEIIF